MLNIDASTKCCAELLTEVNISNTCTRTLWVISIASISLPIIYTEQLLIILATENYICSYFHKPPPNGMTTERSPLNPYTLDDMYLVLIIIVCEKQSWIFCDIDIRRLNNTKTCLILWMFMAMGQRAVVTLYLIVRRIDIEQIFMWF